MSTRRKNDARAAARASRNARYYRRKCNGELVVAVTIGAPILSFLERARWLNAADAHDASKVAAAIEALLETSARI